MTRARGLVSSRASGARVSAVSAEPPEDLGYVVERFWTGCWDLRGQEPHTTELVSDPCVHFVFEQSQQESSGQRLVGVWTQLWRRKLSGTGRVIGVKLRPGAARAFLKQSVSEFTNRQVPLDQVLGARLDSSFAERLESVEDEVAFSRCADWLRALRSEDVDVELAVRCVNVAVAEPAITRAQQLAEQVGLPLRSLQQLFRDYVGVSPKWVIRRNRIQEVAQRIERGTASNFAALAAELGYVDQAHMARDFKAATGRSPSQFAQQE